MSERIYLYPMWLRIWHVTNAMVCLTLIVTGVSLQYSSQDAPLISFRIAVKLHNIAGIILLVNYFSFIIGNAFSTNGSHYRVVRKGIIGRLKKQIVYYTVGMFRGTEEPFPMSEKMKFNPIQQFTYIVIMYIFCPMIIITGCLMFFPEVVMGNIMHMNRFLLIDILHVFTGFMISLFLIIHVYFSTISHSKVSSRFKSIVTGYHE